MSTTVPREPDDDFVARHMTLDQRLEDAFERYEQAYAAGPTLLPGARLDLALLLWSGRDLPPQAVRRQIELDVQALVAETPPLT